MYVIIVLLQNEWRSKMHDMLSVEIMKKDYIVEACFWLMTSFLTSLTQGHNLSRCWFTVALGAKSSDWSEFWSPLELYF